MDFADACASIKARMTGAWDVATAPLVWPNETPPVMDTPAPVVHVDIVGGVERVAGYGGGPAKNRYRQSGEIIIRVLVPSGKGAEQARALSATAAAIFRGAKFDGIHCGGAAMTAGGEEDANGNWFEVVRIVPFDFDFIG